MSWISLDKAKGLESKFDYVKVEQSKTGIPYVEVPKEKLIQFLKFIKEDPNYSFKMFIDWTVIDHGQKENPRFQGVLILF